MDLFHADLSRWNGERIDGRLYAPDIAWLWSEAELAEIGLYRPAAADPVPDGMAPVSTAPAWVNGVMQYVHALEEAPPPPRRMIRKSLVKQRLIDLGLMDAAYAVLTSQPVAFARWFDMDYPEVYADDPDALELLEVIGADAHAVMAPT